MTNLTKDPISVACIGIDSGGVFIVTVCWCCVLQIICLCSPNPMWRSGQSLKMAQQTIARRCRAFVSVQGRKFSCVSYFICLQKAICFLDLHFGLMQLCGLFVWVLCSTKLSFSGWNIQTNPNRVGINNYNWRQWGEFNVTLPDVCSYNRTFYYS
jgi:hypothetical protein